MAPRSSEAPPAKSARPPRPTGPEQASGAEPATSPRIDPELRRELEASGWDHPWPLTPEISTPVTDPDARAAAWSAARMIEAEARDAFVMSADPIALDLSCGEGWLCHELLRWGARSVTGFEASPERLRRARLLREHLAIPEAELELREGGELLRRRQSDIGRFDVVLVGIGARAVPDGPLLELAAASTRALCALECAGAATQSTALAARGAGFASVERVPPPPHASPLYVLEQRELLLARPPATAEAS